MPVALVLGSTEAKEEGTAERLRAGGMVVRTARTRAELLEELARQPIDLLVLDGASPGDDLRAAVEDLRAAHPGMACLSSWNPAEPEASLSGALPRVTARADVGEDPIVFQSASMARVMARLQRVAGLDATVLVTGESGTGKELIARYLHENHPRRRRGPLVCLHCGAIPDALLESELFGHTRGAFTGAERERVGKFEQAHGGTLFLDEISTMKPDAQVKLLRVLQDRRVTRLGSSESRPVDVRVVVATNADLRLLVESGAFRLDLYHRVRTFPVTLPPLRERPSDIAPLVARFCGQAHERLGLSGTKRFSAGALAALQAHPFPGNVRELENAVDYACIVAEGREEVQCADLPSDIVGLAEGAESCAPAPLLTDSGLSFRTAVSNLERELILQSLRLADGNKARAAALLDLKRTTFLEKLDRLRADGLLPALQVEASDSPS